MLFVFTFGTYRTQKDFIGLYPWRSALARLAYAWLSVPIMEK